MLRAASVLFRWWDGTGEFVVKQQKEKFEVCGAELLFLWVLSAVRLQVKLR